MTLYLLDTNVFIRADGDYYPLDRIPGFWEWLKQTAESGHIKTPHEIYDEVAKSKDQLGNWLKKTDVREAIILNEQANAADIIKVIKEGYAADLNEVELEAIGRDPFLVAAALGDKDRVVVTREVSRPSKQRQNRKVPDVCATFNIECITDFELWRRLNFRL